MKIGQTFTLAVAALALLGTAARAAGSYTPGEPVQGNFENFAQSVSCLLTSPKPNASEREALISLVRESFPDYLAAKRTLSETQDEQTKKVQELGPLLLDKASRATEDDTNPEDLDESALIMWKLAQIDEQIEALMKQINLLKRQILTWVKWEDPSAARAVNWALEHA